MSNRALDQLAQVLSRTVPKRSTAGSQLNVDLYQFGVTVDGVGRIGHPLSADEARRLRAIAEPAPYGLGEQTLVDPMVRDTWRIPTHLVHVDWAGKLDAVLDAAHHGLGLRPGLILTAEFHSLLLYERGQFFAPHRDSEKSDDMLGTLVITLPSRHTGGALVIGHGADATTHPGSASRTTAVAFYGDVLHEVTPVESGRRISLTFNLIASRAGMFDDAQTGRDASSHGVDSEDIISVAAGLIRHHFTTAPPSRWSGDSQSPADRLAYLLDHSYTQRGLSWDLLKGADAERLAILRAAAEQADAAVTLALLNIREQRSDDEDDWYDYRHDEGFEDDEPYAGEHDRSRDGDALGEILDSEVAVTHWIRPGTKALREVSLPFGESEVCASTPTASMQPYQYEHEGYMGNYGNTVDRWYRRAAVLVWPRALTFAIQAEASPEWALADARKRLARKDSQAQAEVVADLLSMRASWPPSDRAAMFEPTLDLAPLVDDPDVATFLLAPFSLSDLTPASARRLVTAAERYGSEWALAVVLGWSSPTSRPGTPAMLEDWVATLPDLCRVLRPLPGVGDAILSVALGRQTTHAESLISSPPTSSTLRELRRMATPLAAILLAVAESGSATQVARIVTLCTSRPGVLPLLVPLVRAAHTWPRELQDAAHLSQLRTSGIEHLERRLAVPPRDPADWSIPHLPACDCGDCAHLNAFLQDRDAVTLEWPLAQAGRRHIHARVDAAELPLTHVTRRSGRPFTLVLTKTSALHTRAREAREEDERNLAELRTGWEAST